MDSLPVSVSYARSPTPKLTYAHSTPPNDSVDTVDGDRIVALIPHGSSSPQLYTLFYATATLPNPESPDSEEKEIPAHTYLHTLPISHPPSDLLADYCPGPDSFLHLLTQQRQRDSSNLHVVLSLGSGAGHAKQLHHNLLQPLLDALDLPHTLRETASAHSISDFARDELLPAAHHGKQQNIILLSGDGGIVDLLNGLLPPETSAEPLPPAFARPRVALLPLGTGNALAHSSGITNDSTHGLAAAIRGAPARLPIFSVGFNPPARPYSPDEPDAEAEGQHVGEVHGAVVFSWALHAALVADSDTPAYRKHGAERFKMAAFENLFASDGAPTHPYHGSLKLLRDEDEGGDGALGQPPEAEAEAEAETRRDKDEDGDRQHHNYILATFCSHLEKSFAISPRSPPLPRTLRAVHFGGKTGAQVAQVMRAAYDRGGHVSLPGVRYDAVAGLELTVLEEERRYRRVCVDGRIYVVEPGATVRVRERRGRSPLDLVWLDRPRT